jgi:hypothetical protein
MGAVRCLPVHRPRGAICVRGTRATLYMIVTAFHAGATAEEDAQKFPTRDPSGRLPGHYALPESTTDIDAYPSQPKATATPEVRDRKALRAAMPPHG